MRPKFVFDTNAIVSALLLPRSAPRQAFDLALGTGSILASTDSIAELNDVLRRRRFNKYVAELQRLEFLAALLRESELVQVVENVRICRDPKDDKFLSLAISGRASCVITGDEDLLVLHPFREILILKPAEFLMRDWHL